MLINGHLYQKGLRAIKNYISQLIAKRQNPETLEFSKRIVLFLIRNGVIWVYLSYLLALLGKAEIAETLSKTVVMEVIGVVAVYCAKSLFENLSKNNNWPDKPGTKNTDVDC